MLTGNCEGLRAADAEDRVLKQEFEEGVPTNLGAAVTVTTVLKESEAESSQAAGADSSLDVVNCILTEQKKIYILMLKSLN